MKHICLVPITLLVVFSTCYSYGNDKIAFLGVKDNCQECDMSQFKVGRDLFDNYKFFWLSEEFIIRSKPDIYFTHNDIINISIEKVNVSSKIQPNSSVITVVLKPAASEKLRNYSEKNIGKKVALMVNSKIVTILNIHFKLENAFSFGLRKSTIEIEEIFRNYHEKLIFQN